MCKTPSRSPGRVLTATSAYAPAKRGSPRRVPEQWTARVRSSRCAEDRCYRIDELRRRMIDHTEVAAPDRQDGHEAADNRDIRKKVIGFSNEVRSGAIAERVVQNRHRHQEE